MLFPVVSAALFNQLGASGNADILAMSYAYNMWLPLTAPLIAYSFISNSIFRCQGDTVTPFIAMGSANLINGIMDYIFIFVCDWGVGGAGAATFVGRACAAAYICHKMKRNRDISLPIFLLPERAFMGHWKPIVAIGIPVALATGSIALGFGGVNRVLSSFGHHAVAAWLLGIRIEDFYFMVAMGVGSALTPFLAFNYGRRDLPRMMEGLKTAIIIAGTIMTVIGAVIYIWPHVFLGFFNPSERVLDLASRSIRASLPAYPIVVMQFTMGSLFIATGYSIFATATQLTRSIIGRIPAAWFFAWWLGERGVWWFQPSSLVLSGLVTWLGYLYVVKKIRENFIHTP
jgi:putative MATE family efflux protein